MKQRTYLKQGLQLNLAPELSQAIRLLQLSTLELSQEIERLVESNPLLEYEEAEISETAPNTPSVEQQLTTHQPQQQGQTTLVKYQDDFQDIDIRDTSSDTLRDFLLQQLIFAKLSEDEQVLAIAIIDNLDDDGYLTETLDNLVIELGQLNIHVSIDTLENILRKIQQFEPAGVACRSLQECLQIQLSQHQPNDLITQIAKTILHDYHEVLRDFPLDTLAKKLQQSPENVQHALQLLHTFNPKPGANIGFMQIDYIIPDVICVQLGETWQVQLNDAMLPSIGVNQRYLALLRQSSDARDSQFMRDNLREAKWFLKSLETRNQTLLRVAQCIIDAQHAFLQHGASAMQPLVLQDIAKQLDIHESTVSRITTQKYIYTPRGIYELKYFFSSQVTNDDGSHCSATAIRALIKQVIAGESPEKPLSDHQIATLLQQDHQMNVARRTISKYREAMQIPSSSERRNKLGSFA